MPWTLATLRPLKPADLPEVVALMQAHLLRERLPSTNDLAFLAATLVDAPWADPAVPSLVAESESGDIVGFVGRQRRNMRLDGHPMVAAVLSHLVVTPDSRARAVGPQLLRNALAGPQELTWSDTATELVARMWRAMGGWVDHVRACDWMLVLRSGAWTGGTLRAGLRERKLSRGSIPVGALPVQALGRRVAPRAYPDPEPEVSSRNVTPAELTEHLTAVDRGTRLSPAYTPAELEGLLALVTESGGRVRSRLVQRGERVAGWYVYALRRSLAQVLAVRCGPQEASAVLQALLADARADGAAVVSGRHEPNLTDALSERMAVLGFARRAIVHSRHEGAREALLMGSAALTRLDGEWWVN